MALRLLSLLRLPARLFPLPWRLGPLKPRFRLEWWCASRGDDDVGIEAMLFTLRRRFALLLRLPMLLARPPVALVTLWADVRCRAAAALAAAGNAATATKVSDRSRSSLTWCIEAAPPLYDPIPTEDRRCFASALL